MGGVTLNEKGDKKKSYVSSSPPVGSLRRKNLIPRYPFLSSMEDKWFPPLSAAFTGVAVACPPMPAASFAGGGIEVSPLNSAARIGVAVARPPVPAASFAEGAIEVSPLVSAARTGVAVAYPPAPSSSFAKGAMEVSPQVSAALTGVAVACPPGPSASIVEGAMNVSLPVSAAPTGLAVSCVPEPAASLAQAKITHQCHKSRLIQYTQRCGIQNPTFQTNNLGSRHAPAFQSVVTVDGHSFISSSTFSHVKEAEQDAARVAFEGIKSIIKQEGCPLLHKELTLSKGILHEFAAKLNVPFPTYEVNKLEGTFLAFLSTVRFRGEVYIGGKAKSKRDAEHMAARLVIESILGTSDGTRMMEIIKVKTRNFESMFGIGETVPSKNELHGRATMEALSHEQNASVPVPPALLPAPNQTDHDCKSNVKKVVPLLPCFQQGPLVTSSEPATGEISRKRRRSNKKKKHARATKRMQPFQQVAIIPTTVA